WCPWTTAAAGPIGRMGASGSGPAPRARRGPARAPSLVTAGPVDPSGRKATPMSHGPPLPPGQPPRAPPAAWNLGEEPGRADGDDSLFATPEEDSPLWPPPVPATGPYRPVRAAPEPEPEPFPGESALHLHFTIGRGPLGSALPDESLVPPAP